MFFFIVGIGVSGLFLNEFKLLMKLSINVILTAQFLISAYKKSTSKNKLLL